MPPPYTGFPAGGPARATLRSNGDPDGVSGGDLVRFRLATPSGRGGGLVRERGEQLGQRDAQGGGELLDVLQADVLLAPLDRPDVCAMQARPVGERLLRP